MAKKFFLRKSHSDLVQEQNRMLQTLLDQKTPLVAEPQTIITVRSNNDVHEEEHQNEIDDSFSFDFDDDMDVVAPYIHINTTESTAQLHGVETDKVNFDEENVEKLKKARRSKRN